MEAVVSDWRNSPFTRVSTVMSVTSIPLRSVSVHGPMAPERSQFLPCVTLNLPWRIQSRIDPSFITVSPATWSIASA